MERVGLNALCIQGHPLIPLALEGERRVLKNA